MMRSLWTVTLVATACQPVPGLAVFVTSGFTDEEYQRDGASDAVLDTVAVNPRRREADEPHGIAVAPDGVTIVTANRGAGSVSLIDATLLTEPSRIPIDGAFPHGVAIDATGRLERRRRRPDPGGRRGPPSAVRRSGCGTSSVHSVL